MYIPTPVAIVFYNRPEYLGQLVNALSAHRFAKLYLIADGPKTGLPHDRKACDEARHIAERLAVVAEDLFCVYAPSNMGCRQRIRSGLDLLFVQCDEAIILEDDCIPSPDFFRFAEELLARYRDKESVAHIAGCNRGLSSKYFSSSYAFSRFPLGWGWATWRRAWMEYRDEVDDWPQICQAVWGDDHRALAYWHDKYERLQNGEIDTWDYSWQLSLWRNHRRAIVPKYNMVKNVGFGDLATHTRDVHWQGSLETCPMSFPLSHPAGNEGMRIDTQLQHRIYHPRGRYVRQARRKAALRSMVGRLQRLTSNLKRG